MALQLEDGKGTGYKASVDVKNRLLTKSVVLPEIHDTSDGGDSYAWASGTYNYAAGDTILLLKNTGSKLDIQGVWLSADADTRVVIHFPTTEVTVTGTTITGVNLNTGGQEDSMKPTIARETLSGQVRFMRTPARYISICLGRSFWQKINP